MIYKVSELQGSILNIAVAKALGTPILEQFDEQGCTQVSCANIDLDTGPSEDHEFGDYFEPSTKWGHAGPIISKYDVAIEPKYGLPGEWMASRLISDHDIVVCSGSGPMEAAMRVFIASECGETIEL